MSELTRRGFIGTALSAGTALPAIGTFALAQSPNAAQANVKVESDVVFGKGGDMDLKLDIYRPPAGVTPKRMATIHFHGGGFTGGNKESLSERVKPYAALGYVAIAAQYRLAGQAGYPALVHDAKAAIRWVRANAATLGIESQRIGVVGYSAGGYHALFTAGTGDLPEFEGIGGNAGVSTKVAVCLAYYPATNVPSSMMPAGSDAAALKAANAATYIAAGYPPIAIFHGMKDTTIPIESSKRLVQQFQDVQVPVEFHAFEGVPHVFDSNPEFAVISAQLADFFIDRHVLNPRTYPPFQPGGDGGKAVAVVLLPVVVVEGHKSLFGASCSSRRGSQKTLHFLWVQRDSATQQAPQIRIIRLCQSLSTNAKSVVPLLNISLCRPLLKLRHVRNVTRKGRISSR
jgi:acetyl esterase/lipase